MMNHRSPRADSGSIRPRLNLSGLCLSLLIVTSMTAIAWGQGKVDCNDPNVICPKAPKRPKPPRRQPQPKHLLLSINWQIQTIDKRGMEVPISPNASDWSNVEGARILVQVNQSGYLYVVSQTIEKNNDLSQPQVVYSGVVAKDNVIDLPAPTQTRAKIYGKYWWKVAGSSSRPIVTVFFCRAPLEELERGTIQTKDKDIGVDYGTFLALLQNTAAPRRRSLPFVTETPAKPSGFRNSLTPVTQTLARPQGITGSFVTTSTTPKRDDDEVLAEIIEIKRGGGR